ncbi:MAG: SPOR domain-containing protein [Gammaproteobacteria bacterium]
MKERLTGAIILVALLVLLVPELLTGSGHSGLPAYTTTSVDGEQMRSYTIDLADDGAHKVTTAPPIAPVVETPVPASQMKKAEQAVVASAESPDAKSADGDSRNAAGSDTAQVENASAAESEKPPTPEVTPPPVRVAKPTPPPVAPPVVTAKAPAPSRSAKVEPAPSAKVAAPAGKGWVVQVGSFASRDNAERLARELKGKGFAANVSESSGKGKRLWRVRVGPEGDRAAAVALGAKLRAAGRPGAVAPL